MKKTNRVEAKGDSAAGAAQGKQRSATRPRGMAQGRSARRAGRLRGYVRAEWIGERVSEFTDEPETAAAYWFQHVARYELFDRDKEQLVVLLLNTKYQMIGWNLVSVGTLNSAEAHPREVLRPAVAAAHSIIVMHNHPSGNTGPSEGDYRCTDEIGAACGVLRIPLLDHVIVGRREEDVIFSFKAWGLLPGQPAFAKKRREKAWTRRPDAGAYRKSCLAQLEKRERLGEQIASFFEGYYHHTLHKRGRQFRQAWSDARDPLHSPVKSKRITFREALRIVYDNELAPAIEKAIPECMRREMCVTVEMANAAERKAA